MPATALDPLLDALRAAVGAGHVLTDVDLTTGYGTDWTRRWTSPPLAVVRPKDTAEITRVLQVATAYRTPVVPQGGNTGLVGGSVPHPQHPAIVLSTRRLTRLDPIDVTTRQVVAGAGVTLAALQQHADAAGLRYAVDLAARDSATVGGTVATNAGGLRAVAFGDTRRQVVGVEAVLADGSSITRLAGLAKDNAGYDLSQLLVGSEGTLAIITAVRLRLLPPPSQAPQVVLIGLPDPQAALGWLGTPGLTAAELVLDRGLALVEQLTGLPHPWASRHPVGLLLEVEGDLPEALADEDTAVGQQVWAYRERHTEAIATRGVVHKLDVAVPVARTAELITALDAAWDGAVTRADDPREAYVFGHLGDGNLHINVVDPDRFGGSRRVEETVYGLVLALGGTVAAEHGVGVAKRSWVRASRTATDLAAQRAIKGALDPDGLLNPGVLLP